MPAVSITLNPAGIGSGARPRRLRTLVTDPRLDIALTRDLAGLRLDDDILDHAFVAAQDRGHAECGKAVADDLIVYREADIGGLDTPQEVADLRLTSHPVGRARRRVVAIFVPFRIVDIKIEPGVHVLCFEGALEGGKIEPRRDCVQRQHCRKRDPSFETANAA
jgi:hypothetical protein